MFLSYPHFNVEQVGSSVRAISYGYFHLKCGLGCKHPASVTPNCVAKWPVSQLAQEVGSFNY